MQWKVERVREEWILNVLLSMDSFDEEALHSWKDETDFFNRCN